MKSGKVKDPAAAQQKAQEILDAVHEAKRAMYDTQGLSGVSQKFFIYFLLSACQQGLGLNYNGFFQQAILIKKLFQIEPDDDGLWHKDMRLNLEQAQFLQNEITGVNGAPTKIPRNVKSGRDKRFAVFMESFPASKWNLPIGYVIGSDLSKLQMPSYTSSYHGIQII